MTISSARASGFCTGVGLQRSTQGRNIVIVPNFGWIAVATSFAVVTAVLLKRFGTGDRACRDNNDCAT